MIKKLNFLNKDAYKALLIVTAVFILTGILKLFLYEGNDETTIEEALRGLYWKIPVTNFHYCFRGISHIFVWLYSHFNVGINYLGVSLVLLNWITFVLLSYFLIKYLDKGKYLFLLLFLYISYYNIYIVSYTRISILASFAGLLWFLYALLDVSVKKTKISILFLATLIIIFSYLIRPQGGILGFVLFLPFFVWRILFDGFSKKTLIALTVLLPTFFSVVLDNQIVNRLEPQPPKYGYERVLDYGNVFTPQNREQEKILFEVQSWFLVDKETQKLIAFKYLLDVDGNKNLSLFNQKKYFLLSDRIYWQLKTYIFIPFFNQYPLILSFISLALLYLLFFINKALKKTITQYLFSACYFFIILYMFYYMKIEDRAIIPLLTIMIYFLILTLPHNIIFQKTGWIKYLSFSIILILLVFIVLQFNLIRKDISKRENEAEFSLKALKGYNDSKKGNVVFLTLISPGSDYYALKHVEWDKNNLQIPLFGWTAFYKQNYETLQKITGSNKVNDIFTWIANNPQTASVYSNPSQNKILIKIFEYNDFKAELIPTCILDKNSQDGFYKISLTRD